MCNLDEYINNVAAYIGSVINENIVTRPVSKSVQDILPISIVNSFRLYQAQMLGKDVILAYIEDGNMTTPVLAKRQLDIIQRKTGMITVLVPEYLFSYNIGRLVAQKVNFVIPNKQVFIPSLLLDLKNIKK